MATSSEGVCVCISVCAKRVVCQRGAEVRKNIDYIGMTNRISELPFPNSVFQT